MGQEAPFFSIIVPTFARPGQLLVCLQALSRLKYPRDRFETIVVDDGSEVPPEEAVAAFKDRLDVTLVTQPNAGPAAARNAGADRARGAFLAFTDDDCAPSPTWLKHLALCFAQAPEHLVGGQTVNALPDNIYSNASQILIDYLYDYYNADRSDTRFFASNNLALPASCFHATGGFDSVFACAAAEDREFCDRWLSKGNRMTYAPDAVVYHAHALRWQTFCRLHFRYGQGAFYFHRVRSRRVQRRIKIEPVSFYVNLVKYPFPYFSRRRALRLAALMGVSQVAHTAGFFWGKAREAGG